MRQGLDQEVDVYHLSDLIFMITPGGNEMGHRLSPHPFITIPSAPSPHPLILMRSHLRGFAQRATHFKDCREPSPGSSRASRATPSSPRALPDKLGRVMGRTSQWRVAGVEMAKFTVLGCQAGSQHPARGQVGSPLPGVLILRFVTPEGSELGFRVSNVAGGAIF